MSRLKVAAIVEGHGEVTALPILLRRIWYEIIQGEYIDIVHDQGRGHRVGGPALEDSLVPPYCVITLLSFPPFNLPRRKPVGLPGNSTRQAASPTNAGRDRRLFRRRIPSDRRGG